MKSWLATYRTPLLLTLLTLGMLLVMEAAHPYFFLQDDNRTYHLPYHLHNLRALLGGELPLFNFNQYLGTPVSFLSAPFYPLNYLALLLSRLFLGHYFGAMEFIAAMHLVIGVLGFYRFARGLALDGASSSFGAIAWGFSPFVITIGNSWIHTLGYAAWLPWILHYSLRQLDGFSIRPFLALLGVRLLALLLGYPQWFLYTATFDLLLVGAFHLLKKRDAGVPGCGTGALILAYFGNYLALALLSLPVLLQLLRESSLSVGRKGVLPWDVYSLYSYGISQWLHGLFVPFLDVPYHYFGELHFVSHVGYLTLVFVPAALFLRGAPSRNRRVTVFALLALLSFLWSADILVARLVYYLPVFGKMRYPFKLQMFTGFFLVTLASYGCNAFFARLKGKAATTTLTVLVLLLHIANFLVLYGCFPQNMLSHHLDVPPFAEPLAREFDGGRIVSAGPDVIWDGERVVPGATVPTLGYNYAMLWGLYQLGGYEALLSEQNFNAALGLINNSIFNVPAGSALDFQRDVPLDYLREWGVGWYVVSGGVSLANTDGLIPLRKDRYRTVLRDPAAKPLVYLMDGGGGDTVSYRIGTNSIRMETDVATDGRILVNFLYNPNFTASLDGKPLPVSTTEVGQMVLPAPGGKHVILLAYRDPWFSRGLWVAAITLLLLAGWGLAAAVRPPDAATGGT